jgi:hypothetical protein
MTNFALPHHVRGRCPLGDECPCWREGWHDKDVRFLPNPAPLHAYGPLPSPYVMRHNSRRESLAEYCGSEWLTTLVRLGFTAVVYHLVRKTWHWIRA